MVFGGEHIWRYLEQHTVRQEDCVLLFRFLGLPVSVWTVNGKYVQCNREGKIWQLKREKVNQIWDPSA